MKEKCNSSFSAFVYWIRYKNADVISAQFICTPANNVLYEIKTNEWTYGFKFLPSK